MEWKVCRVDNKAVEMLCDTLLCRIMDKNNCKVFKELEIFIPITSGDGSLWEKANEGATDSSSLFAILSWAFHSPPRLERSGS